MYATTYHRATSAAEAIEKIKASGEAEFLAGGQTLLPTMKARLAMPDALIDLAKIEELKGITIDGGTVTIGAMTTHAAVAQSKAVAQAFPCLAAMAKTIGDPSVRHRGTIGGSLANNDPSADYPSVTLGTNATIVTDRREIAADEFFQGLFTTALEEGELITKVVFTAPKRAGYGKFHHPASRYPMVGVFVAENADGVRVTVTGSGADGVFRHGGLERALSDDMSAAAVDGVEVTGEGLLADMHGSAAYRANLIKVMARRAVEQMGLVQVM